MRRFFAAAAILIAVNFAGTANAQTELPNSKLSITNVITKTATPLNSTASTSASLIDIAQDPRLEGKDLTDVQIIGKMVPGVATGRGRPVSIEWNAVTKASDPTVKRALERPLRSTVLMPTDAAVLPASKPIAASGDQDQVVAAVISLLDAKEEDEQQATAPAQIQQEEEKSPGTDAQAPASASGDRDDSSERSKFQTPEPIQEVVQAPERVPVTAFTKNGCPVRIDEAQEVAIIQSQTVIDGVEQGDCSDTLERLPLKKDYGVCQDIVNVQGRIAQPAFRRQFTTPEGQTSYIDGECLADDEQRYDIVENADQCGWRVDQTAQTATLQVKLAYTNRNNQFVELTACQDSAVTPALATNINVDACEDRYDQPNDLTYQKGRIEWTYNGETITAQECIETGTIIATTIEGCPVRIDEAAQVAVVREQTQINGIAQGDCADTAVRLSIKEDFASCAEQPDIPNRIVRVMSRQFYKNQDGHTVYLDEACGINPELEFDIVETGAGCGWEINREEETATRLTKLTYTNRLSKHVELTACQPSLDTAPIATTMNLQACTDRVVDGITFERGRIEWIHDDITFSEQSCEDTGKTIGHTRIGCSIRIDELQAVAFVQKQTVVNGVLQQDCEDGEERLPIERDYSICTDAIDQVNRTATARARRFYMDPPPHQTYIDPTCEEASDLVFDIVEDRTGCQWRIDALEGNAILQVKDVYENRVGSRVELSACKDSSETAPIATTMNEAVCTDRYDDLTGTTYVKARREWVYGGANYSTGACEETGTTIAYTTLGCEPRIDLVQNAAIPQQQTVVNGLQQGDCRDTSARLPIITDYSICADVVDLETATANPSYRRRYTSLQAVTVFLDQTCQTDTETTFQIVEDLSACGWILDGDNNTAIKEGIRYYTNRNNNRVEVTDCLPSATVSPIPTSVRTQACDLRHDFGGGVTYQRGRIEWFYKGDIQTDGQCLDTGVQFAHFEDPTGCAYEHNLDTGEAYQTSRTAFIANGVTSYIDTQCVPNPETTVSLQVTYEGCETVFFDNIPGQVSYAAYRQYYVDGNNVRQYVTECLRDDDTHYVHQYRITGYVHDDNLRQSMPQTEIFIETDQGESVRSPSQVRDDAVAIPFTYQAQETTETDTTYSGCDKYVHSELTDIYTRPDGTTYQRVIGPGPTTGPLNACTVFTAPSWDFKSDNVYCTGSNQTGAQLHRSCTYTGSRTLQREDGDQIGQTSSTDRTITGLTSGNRSWPNYGCGHPNFYNAGGTPAPACPTPYTGTDTNAWNQGEGW
jgi:hypothetical protein